MSPIANLLICLRFFSRLPLPATKREVELGTRGLVEAVALAPIAGAIVGLAPVAVIAAAAPLSIPGSVAAPLAIAALVAVTGALHEDALADCADGFGGGRTRERKLEIMRDSRIGAFGMVAVGLALLVRSSALAAALAHGLRYGIVAILMAAVLSRTACLASLALLPTARDDGVGAAAARPAPIDTVIATTIAFLAAICAGATVGWQVAVIATALAIASTLLVCALAWRQIGGQTGDVAGTALAVAETSVLVAFSAGSW